MKKKILLTFLVLTVLVFTLAITASAADYEYYLVQSTDSQAAETLKAEGKTNILSVWDLYKDAENCFLDSMSEGDTLTLNLAENLSSKTTDQGVKDSNKNPSTVPAIRLDKAITITVNFLEYSWWFTDGEKYDAFILYNVGARLNLIGTKAKNEDGTYKEIATNYTNTVISNEIDIFTNFVVAYQAAGQLYCENLAVYSREEAFYQKDTFVVGHNDITFKNCSLLSSGTFPTIGYIGKSSSSNTLKIDGGRYGTIIMHNIVDGSYIKNATILSTNGGNSLFIDSWKDRNAYELPVENCELKGRYYAEGDGNIIIAKNSTLGILYLKGDSSGGAYITLIDSTYTSVDFVGKSGQLTVITSPDCVNPGIKKDYNKDNTAGVLDSAYSETNKALGHTFDADNIINIVYTSYLENGKYSSKCKACNDIATEETATAAPLFGCLGYSTPAYDNNGAIVIGFTINNTAVAEYTNITGKTVAYGVFAVLKTKLATDEEIVNTDGTSKAGVINAKLTEYDFSSVDLKIVGFTSDEHKALEIAMGVYVITSDENGAEVSYLQAGTPKENDKYCFVTYNSVA